MSESYYGPPEGYSSWDEYTADYAAAGANTARTPLTLDEPVLSRRSFGEHLGRPVTFLRPGVPNRNVTTVAGDGGVGKSLLALSWVADVVAAGGDALVVVAEDGPDVAKLRLRALAVDVRHVHFLSLEWGFDERGEPDYDAAAVSLPGQGEDLDLVVASLGERLRLVVIDPWAECLDDSVDSHKATSLRRAIAALRRIASRRDVAIVVVAHLNKSASLSLRKRVDGSGALYDGSRSVLLLAKDPDDEDVRVLAHDKSNVSELIDAREYRVEPILVPAEGEEPQGETARLVDAEQNSTRTVEELLGERAAESEPTAEQEAQEWLRDALNDGEWHDSAGLKTLARASEIAERTLKRASKTLGVEHERRGFPSSTWWRLDSRASALGSEASGNASDPTANGRESRMDSGVPDPPQSSQATSRIGDTNTGPSALDSMDDDEVERLAGLFREFEVGPEDPSADAGAKGGRA